MAPGKRPLGVIGWITTILLWTSADNTLYSSALAVLAATKIRKSTILPFLAVLGMIAAMTGIIERYLGFIILLGVFVPPLVGVLIAHFWLLSKGRYHSDAPPPVQAILVSLVVVWAFGSSAASKVKQGVKAAN